MKLKKQILDQISPELVERINEIYHDLEATLYQNIHKYMDGLKKGFWERAAQEYFVKDEPTVSFDFGTGTGFVPLAVAGSLKAEDTFICGDISSEMLKECERNVKAKPFFCKFSFVKIEGIQIPLPDSSVDVMTVNSVLHHILDLKGFSKECVRVLKPNGLFITSHEPNAHKLLGKPKNFFFKLAEISPIMEKLMRVISGRVSTKYRLRNKMLSDIIKQLKAEGLIDFNLRGTEIQQIVDFHTQHGFTKEAITVDNFPQFELVEYETYNNDASIRFVLSRR